MKHTLPLLALMTATAFAAEKKPLPAAQTTRTIEGWTVRVDDRLLKGQHAAVGQRALKLLESRLVAITFVVPEKSLAKLRAIPIELDFDYGDLVPMQYHPDAGWLKEHGYSEQLAKCVHIPGVEDFLEPSGIHSQPWVVLHELAHGFHDQIIGFEDARVLAAWKKFRDSGKYQSALTASGKNHEHYGRTDEKEFFAEMTEAYFGSNDFYPFVSGELKQAKPEIFALLADIWGPLPGSVPPKPEANDNTQAERVAKITKQLSRAGKLPGPLLDAHFVEEQTGDGLLGPSDFKWFYALTVAPADLPAWRAALSKVKTWNHFANDEDIKRAAPKKAQPWWVNAADLGKLEYSPHSLTGHANGWVGIAPDGRIFIHAFTM